MRIYMRRFYELLAHAVGVSNTHIRILSMQNIQDELFTNNKMEIGASWLNTNQSRLKRHM